MKKIIPFLLLGFALASCSGNSTPCESSPDSPSSSGESQSASFTVTFDSRGGSAVAPIQVAYGEKITAPSAPTYAGHSFTGWFVDSIAVTPFDFNIKITSDWTLYAGWKIEESSSSESSSSEQTSESSSEQPSASSSSQASSASNEAYGPEGSTLVSWYLCGSGSLWGEDGWETSGGVQLYSNPSGPTDLGCLLNVTFAVGDFFKVTNGTSWYGYEKVEAAGAGKTSFRAKSDGYGGSNIECTLAGTYDFYVNKTGSFYVEAHK